MNNDADLIRRIRALSRPLIPIPTGLAPVLSPPAHIRCVLFDIYGTLVISGSGDVGTAGAADQQGALAAALAACDLKADFPASRITETIQQHQARIKTRGIEYPEIDIVEIWRDVLSSAGVGVNDTTRLKQLAVEYEARVNPVWPMPGAWETLATLRERGIRMGIISNAQFYTPLIFPAFTERTVSDWGFDPALCVWSFEQGEGKPSRRLFENALQIVADDGIAPHEVCYVGNDKRNDIWPAASLGCRTALFAGDRRSLRLRENNPQVAATTPDWIVTAWSEFATLFVGNFDHGRLA